jgi:hypothetical protein
MKKLALRNALRYFDAKHHAELVPEFKEELATYGRIYMYRLRPDYEMCNRRISWNVNKQSNNVDDSKQSRLCRSTTSS